MKDNTEEKILEAAEHVFVRKGMDGARMQEIADEAKINKALLHYYFRTKERLFNAILERVINLDFPLVGKALYADVPFPEKVGQIVDIYINVLRKHPYLPAFILKEMSRDASVIFKLITRFGFSLKPVLTMVSDAMERGEVVRMKPEHFIVNIVSLCVFPFAAKPIVSYMLCGNDRRVTDAFFEERKEVVKAFVLKAISPDQSNTLGRSE